MGYWEIRQAYVDTVDKYLKDGWEPFSATYGAMVGYQIFLRKWVQE